MKCKCEWCDRTPTKKTGFCTKHNNQIACHGVISKSIYEPNDFIKHFDFYEIQIRKKSGDYLCSAIIELDQYEKCSKHKWKAILRKNKKDISYVGTRINGETIPIANMILGNVPRNKVVDHIDGNPLNNFKKNLRICYQRENVYNSRVQLNTSSGFKGVSLTKEKNKYRARIRVNRKEIGIGTFFDKEMAAKAYNEAAIKYFGEYAKINILPTTTTTTTTTTTNTETMSGMPIETLE